MSGAGGLSGRVVVVTGGTRGIGRGIADAFAGAGATVVVCGRKAPEGELGLQFVAADVRRIEDVDRLVARVVADHGRLDVWVNNAGGSPYCEAAQASPRFTEAIIALNLTAPLLCAQRAHAVMAAQEGGGVILNVASVSGTRPSPGTAAYGAAKAGLLSATTSLAVEWAPAVRVNAITAGLVDTGSAALHYGGEQGVARVSATVPAGRMGTPEDIAQAALFLASDQAAYITGAQLLVHGGGEWPAFLTAAQSVG